MYLSTRYHIGIFAVFVFSLATMVASAGEGGSYELVDLPQHALAPADTYLVGRLFPEEQPAAQQPAVQQTTVQQNLAPDAKEETQPAQRAQSSERVAKRDADNQALVHDTQSAAEAGDPVAMGRLGVLFQQGVGLPQSYAEAIKWYTRAAEAGDADAMNNLGTLYVMGHGVPQDSAEAKKWYQRAADAGSVTAMINIAKMYYFGVGVARSYPEAANWFQRASIRGSAIAMNSLSLMYDSGNGVSQDRAIALSLVKEAARLGYGPAMANLGAMYETGDGIESNHVEAYAWIGAALKVGVPNEVREALFYRLGAISARLNTQELTRAQELAVERSAVAPASDQRTSGSNSGDRTSRLNH